jgi:hypothetical protein
MTEASGPKVAWHLLVAVELEAEFVLVHAAVGVKR